MFGYHIMEVLGQKNFGEAYKVAYLSKKIESSEETDNVASSAATQFAGNSRDLKSFEANVLKNNLNKRLADNIHEMDYTVGELPSRAFVKWVYDNKVGTVSEPFDFKNKYVVAVITGNYDEGTQVAAVARMAVEPIVRNQKKAEEIRKKIGTSPSLNLSNLFPDLLLVNLIHFVLEMHLFPMWDLSKKQLVQLLTRRIKRSPLHLLTDVGVFVVKVNSIGALPNLGVDPVAQRKSMVQQMKQYAAYGAFEALKKAAKIEDTREELPDFNNL